MRTTTKTAKVDGENWQEDLAKARENLAKAESSRLEVDARDCSPVTMDTHVEVAEARMEATTKRVAEACQAATLAVLRKDAPETLRLMNSPAICEECLRGRDVCLQDDELPSEEEYELFDAALTVLEKKGLVAGTELWGLTAWSYTPKSFA
jgi:hypothetical protein